VIELSQSQIDDLRDINQLCLQLRAELVIIGAIAYQVNFPDEERHTGDIDFAVALDLADFAELSAHLSGLGWTQLPSLEHRWRTGRGNLLDLLPAGKELRESKQITWPKSKVTMSLVGFDHVFSAARPVALAADLVVPVIPPIVLMLLKVIAFMDDHQRRRKDLSDIRALLSQYEAGSDRIFIEAIGEVSDYSVASAFLLGRDLRALCADEEFRIVRAFVAYVEDEARSSWWDFVRAAPRPGERNEETAREQLKAFSAAFL
jgi:predicted nucleotidyltransferase